MKNTAKTEYACLAMIELAASWDCGETVRMRDLAEKHAIPGRFLVQIMLQLKAAGLVVSVRGATGGYRLARPPDEISLGEVIDVFTPSHEGAPAESGESAARRVLDELWREVDQSRQQILHGVTLEQLAARAQRERERMYYI